MKIQDQITSLLFRYDCVIIPGLGGFVANHHPSKVSTDRDLAFPPSKGIIFNKNLVSNDGLLAESICRNTGMSYEDANQAILQFVNESRDKMNRGERVEFEGLGLLFLDQEHNIQFHPDFSVNFLIDSFGLFPVVAKEVVRTVKEIRNEEVSEEAVVIPIKQNPETKTETIAPQKSAIRRFWPAAAAVLLPIVFYSVWIPTHTDFLHTGKIEFADLNPFHSNTPVYETRKSAPIVLEINNADEWLNVVENAGGPVAKLVLSENGNYLNIAVTEDIQPASPESTFVAKSGVVDRGSQHVHIIGGCFRELGNAEHLVSDLKAKGHDAYILDIVGGLHRVAINSYATKNEAMNALSEIRNSGISSAWLLEK